MAKTIEAENCDKEEDCRLEGHWKEWADGGFRNNRLISNEETSMGTAADSSTLVLSFQGTGIIIVFRQDTWYGSLRVEIDNRVEEINQRGAAVNQVEALFEVDGEGPHSLVLNGSKNKGVITIDAIKILE